MLFSTTTGYDQFNKKMLVAVDILDHILFVKAPFFGGFLSNNFLF